MKKLISLLLALAAALAFTLAGCSVSINSPGSAAEQSGTAVPDGTATKPGGAETNDLATVEPEPTQAVAVNPEFRKL